LLRAHRDAGNFLGGVAHADGTIEDSPIVERPGTVIGPYKLLEQIGEGGFGVVFLAEQQRPVRRKVALKIIKPGMDTRQVVARSEAERQALAMMEHPNIARVLDAGAVGVHASACDDVGVHASACDDVGVHASACDAPGSLAEDTLKRERSARDTLKRERSARDTLKRERSARDTLKRELQLGRPYFVMELVQGVPVTEYCDQCSVSTRERLELFITVGPGRADPHDRFGLFKGTASTGKRTDRLCRLERLGHRPCVRDRGKGSHRRALTCPEE